MITVKRCDKIQQLTLITCCFPSFNSRHLQLMVMKIISYLLILPILLITVAITIIAPKTNVWI